nr:hypothetical protein [Frankia gtarii]
MGPGQPADQAEQFEDGDIGPDLPGLLGTAEQVTTGDAHRLAGGVQLAGGVEQGLHEGRGGADGFSRLAQTLTPGAT